MVFVLQSNRYHRSDLTLEDRGVGTGGKPGADLERELQKAIHIYQNYFPGKDLMRCELHYLLMLWYRALSKAQESQKESSH